MVKDGKIYEIQQDDIDCIKSSSILWFSIIFGEIEDDVTQAFELSALETELGADSRQVMI